MAAPIPAIEPQYIQAGDTVSWTRHLFDHPASAWTLKYRLINASGKIDISAVADGEMHSISVDAAVTATWAAGEYTWQSYVEGGTSERHTIGRGRVIIRPDLASKAAGFEARSTARKALDDTRAALAAWISSHGHVNEADIGGRRVRFANVADIQGRIQFLEREVAREEAAEKLAAGINPPRRVLVRF